MMNRGSNSYFLQSTAKLLTGTNIKFQYTFCIKVAITYDG